MHREILNIRMMPTRAWNLWKNLTRWTQEQKKIESNKKFQTPVIKGVARREKITSVIKKETRNDKLTEHWTIIFTSFLSLKRSTSLMSSELICGTINLRFISLSFRFRCVFLTSLDIATTFTCFTKRNSLFRYEII